MHKKIAIFPIDHNTVTFARYAYMGNYEAIALLAPQLNVLEGNDISKIDGGTNANIQLHIDYKLKIWDCDVVYFTNSDLIQDMSIYHDLIEYAKDLGKETIIAKSVLARLGQKAETECCKQQPIFFDDSIPPKLMTIEAPIISLFTIGENCGQPQTELSMREFFLNKDYHVMQIGTQEYSNVIGCINLPSFMFDSTVDSQKKIIMLNRFVYDLYMSEKPELILIGVPNPIMKYNDVILNGFGIIPFIIHNAIKSDIGVLSIYYGEYTHEYLKLITQFCKYRFDVQTKYFSIANSHVSKNIDDPSKLEYLYVNTDFVKSNFDVGIGKEDFTLFSPYDKESMEKALHKIEDELLSNPNQI